MGRPVEARAILEVDSYPVLRHFSVRRFFMFLPTGLLGDIAGQGSSPQLRLVLSMILSGTISVAYIVVSNRPRWFPVLIAAHILIIWQFDRVVPATTMPMTGAALQARLKLDTTIVSSHSSSASCCCRSS